MPPLFDRRIRATACLLLVAVFIFPGFGGFTESQFKCEEAVSHLADCCPDFEPRAHNCTRETGCGEVTSTPELSRRESECIKELTCAQILDSGLCDGTDLDEVCL